MLFVFLLLTVTMVTAVVYYNSLVSGNILYSVGTWEADSLGNHRAIVEVTDDTDAVLANIVWRRRDKYPENKAVIIIDENTNKKINNKVRIEINREYGKIVFQPESGSGRYYFYYLPYMQEGRSNYPTVTYREPDNNADLSWLEKHNLSDKSNLNENAAMLPEAAVVEFQSIDSFNSFYPMEVIATQSEVNELLAQHSAESYLLFPEGRKYPIRMNDDLPLRWIQNGAVVNFSGKASRGEFYAFQVGVFSIQEDIEDIQVDFTGLQNSSNEVKIPASGFSSFNTEGINWDGNPFDRTCSVKSGKVQAMWFGIQIPKEIKSSKYNGILTIKPDGLPEKEIEITIDVSNEVLEDAGDSEPWKHSRMRWLNSTMGFDDEIVPPFTPVEIIENKINILGRQLELNSKGLPEKIRSYFTPEVTKVSETTNDILSSSVQFIILNSRNNRLNWQNNGVNFTKQAAGIAEWNSENTAGPINISINGSLEFDGYAKFKVKMTTSETINLNDIRLEIPMTRDAAKYILGFGEKGGTRPRNLSWKWDVTKHQEGAWLGNVNKGIHFILRDDKYSRPLNTNFYQAKPLVMPKSWYNEGLGGCNITESRNSVQVRAYSGKRTLNPGEELYFNFNLMITPFKPLDTNAQWSTRFFHRFKPVDSVAVTGANTINVHHANEANPYINYPFIATKEMKAYVDEAHAKGMKVKIYNTIRELSNRAPEIFAIRSLGSEIFSEGAGGGFSWLQEHLGKNYIAAWFVPHLKDAAIINSGMSRWHNYYIEGLDWLTKNIEIDGLYIDDVAYDRTTMKRVRKILDRNRDGAIIDFHSANQYNPRDGFTNSAILYMEHFPYINRLWLGEYFDYDSKPDFWITEVSGVPFGLMGEMLQQPNNPWRGMLYGMTARLPWAGDPTPMWKFWDEFGMVDTEMYGYWSPNCPVKTGRQDILATAYIKDGKTLAAVASWVNSDVNVNLNIDWDKLGINRNKAKLSAPAIQDFQEAAEFSPGSRIKIPKGKGLLLVIEEK